MGLVSGNEIPLQPRHGVRIRRLIEQEWHIVGTEVGTHLIEIVGEKTNVMDVLSTLGEHLVDPGSRGGSRPQLNRDAHRVGVLKCAPLNPHALLDVSSLPLGYLLKMTRREHFQHLRPISARLIKIVHEERNVVDIDLWHVVLLFPGLSFGVRSSGLRVGRLAESAVVRGEWSTNS